MSLFSYAALDQSVLRALYDFVTRLQTTLSSYFDFLTSFWEDGEEFSIVAHTYWQTLLLLLSAVVLGSCVGLALGLVGGLWPGSRVSGTASALSFVGVLTPSFLLALLVLLLFVRYINPAFGIKFVLVSPLVDVFDPRRLFPPALVLSVRPMAFVAQVTIASLQDVIRTDYVRTAHAKGLLPWTALFRHIMRNISTPVLTAVNSSFFFSLSSILVVEWFFSMGRDRLPAARRRREQGRGPCQLPSYHHRRHPPAHQHGNQDTHSAFRPEIGPGGRNGLMRFFEYAFD